jgi:DNA-binding PadR family transcriptional regulator
MSNVLLLCPVQRTNAAIGAEHLYTALLRLQQQGWIAAEWGTSDNNRQAKFYSITGRGRKQLEVETENWERISDVIGRVLRLEEER